MIRKSLSRKLGVCYFFILFLLFVLLNTVGMSALRNQLIADKKAQVSEYSRYVKEQYFHSALFSNSIYTNKSISREIARTDSILDTQTWITNQNGSLLIDSANDTLQSGTLNILTYDKNYFHSYFYKDKVLGSLMTQPMLSVILPVSQNFQIIGYVIVHYPMDAIDETLNSYMLPGNCILLGICLLLALCFIFTHAIAIRPLRKILYSTSAANQGDYTISPDWSASDELGTLSLEIAYMEDKLRDLDNYQKNFIANVSHDFRSPLTSIKGYAEAMLDGTIPPELYGKYLDVIVFETERLSQLTSNLLSLNQFEQGGRHLELTSFDINAIIKKTALAFEGICTKKHIKLKLTFSEKETFVTADQSRIQQVLHNLLDNAVKFSYKDSEIQIRTVEKKEKVLISVKDFGIGIPKSGIMKIWDRFYKTDLSRGKDKKGTGLGLSITKEIINAHNENINVTSTEGAGTEFTFTLTLTTPNEI